MKDSSQMVGKNCLELYLQGSLPETSNVYGINLTKENIIYFKNQYLQKYATSDEKEEYLKYLDSNKLYLSSIINKQTLMDINLDEYVYQQLINSKTVDLLEDPIKVTLINNYINTYATEEEKQLVFDKFNNDEILEYKIVTFQNNAHYLKKCGQYEILYKKVLKLATTEEQINFILQEGIPATNFKRLIYNFILSQKQLGKEEKKIIDTKLHYIADKYTEYLKSTKAEVEETKSQPLEKSNPEELKSVEAKTKKSTETTEELIVKAKKIIFKLSHGVEENQEVRNYDIFDYYQECKISIDDLAYFVRNNSAFSVGAKKVLTSFARKNDSLALKDYSIEKIKESYTEINCQKDENGSLIMGSGRVITKDEKESIFNYLLQQEIPITQSTYNAAFKRYKNNTLFASDKNKQLIKKD